MTNRGKNWLIAILGLAGVSMYGYIQHITGYIEGAKVALAAQSETEEELETPES